VDFIKKTEGPQSELILDDKAEYYNTIYYMNLMGILDVTGELITLTEFGDELAVKTRQRRELNARLRDKTRNR